MKTQSKTLLLFILACIGIQFSCLEESNPHGKNLANSEKANSFYVVVKEDSIPIVVRS